MMEREDITLQSSICFLNSTSRLSSEDIQTQAIPHLQRVFQAFLTQPVTATSREEDHCTGVNYVSIENLLRWTCRLVSVDETSVVDQICSIEKLPEVLQLMIQQTSSSP